MRALAATGAKVIFTTRDETKAKTATEKSLRGYPEAGIVIKPEQVQHLAMDLANLNSVRAAAKKIRTMTDKLNVLVCNAGAKHSRLDAVLFEIIARLKLMQASQAQTKREPLTAPNRKSP